MKTLENVTPRVNQVTKILKNSNDDFWDQTRQYQIVRYVIEFNVSVAVLDKISNFPLLHSHATSPLFSRYYMLKKLIVARKGMDIAPCPPPKYATEGNTNHTVNQPT